MKQTILLIDDKSEFLVPLAEALEQKLGETANVVPWVPNSSERPLEKFEQLVQNNDVRLVVTDYDLTQQGQLGFFGATVVDWCQVKGIPVGDFSRGNASSLATEPNLFELRVPIQSNDAAVDYIASVFRGFIEIRTNIDSKPELLKQRSPAAALALMLGVGHLESQFSQYGTRYGGANSALIDKFVEAAPKDVIPDASRKATLLTYIMGHLLHNAVLRFPGPIVSSEALAAYLAVNQSDQEKYLPMFTSALFKGPFSELNSYYWTHSVDEVLAQYDERVPNDMQFESAGEYNRVRVETALQTTLNKSADCDRCNGKNGGFWCPFSRKTVCQRSDCSIVSNVWIPSGARLARFERDFYEEWAPILGM